MDAFRKRRVGLKQKSDVAAEATAYMNMGRAFSAVARRTKDRSMRLREWPGSAVVGEELTALADPELRECSDIRREATTSRCSQGSPRSRCVCRETSNTLTECSLTRHVLTNPTRPDC
jgi:hypothetical protein